MAAGIVEIDNVLIGTARYKVLYWSSDGTTAGLLTPLTVIEPGGGTQDVTNQLARASGVADVAGAFGATGVSPAFLPQSGRDIDVLIVATTALTNITIQLERSFDGVNFYPLTINSLPWAVYTIASASIGTAPANESAWNEPKTGAQFRLNCTAWGAGTANYRIAQ